MLLYDRDFVIDKHSCKEIITWNFFVPI
jgi:hypothetical protein